MTPRDQVAAIARRHAIAGEPEPLDATGMVNEAWRIGDHVLRIIRDPDNDDEAAREARVAPLVAAAGIRTPALVAFDLARTFHPRPYTIYRRVDGILLADAGADPARFERLYRELGGELARIARIVPAPGAFEARPIFDARAQLAKTIAADRIPPDDAAAVAAWLDALAPAIATTAPPVFVHKDIHPWNVLIDPATGSLAAIIDWGDACLGDPALELGAMPLVALPAMLDGYAAAGGTVDRGLVARSIWAGIALAAFELRDLDPAVFARAWWRHPPGGWPEHRARADALLARHPR